MAMTKREFRGKLKILKILREEGYPKYAELFDKFDLNITEDPGVIGYMQPGKARIVVNSGLDTAQISLIIRHEILHEYLDHAMRIEKHVGKDKWDKRTNLQHDRANRAMDWELSDLGYTLRDFDTAKGIYLNGEFLEGLVLELDHPDWVGLSMEEIYDRLEQEEKDLEDLAQKILQIGDMGDEAIQEAEEIARQADAYSDDAGDIVQQSGQAAQDAQQKSEEAEANGDDKEAQAAQAEADAESDKADAAKALKGQADKVSKAAKDLIGQAGLSSGGRSDEEDDEIFKSADQIAKEKKIASRLEEIKRAFSSVEDKANILKETEYNVQKQLDIQQQSELEQYKNSAVQKFGMSIRKFFENETSPTKGNSYKRFNKKYVNSGIIKPGHKKIPNKNIPLLYVYFDMSGSWDEEKIAAGKQAVGSLYKFEKAHKLKIRLKYFDTKVQDTPKNLGGGTAGLPVFNDILKYKPENVVIMTDGDIDDSDGKRLPDVTIPGGVWFLFKESECLSIQQHLHGEKLNKSFWL